MTRQRRPSPPASAAETGGATTGSTHSSPSPRGAWALLVGALALGLACVALSLQAAAEHPANPSALPPTAFKATLAAPAVAPGLPASDPAAGPPTSSLTQTEPVVPPAPPAEAAATDAPPTIPPETSDVAEAATTTASAPQAADAPEAPTKPMAIPWHQVLWHELQTTVQREQSVLEQVDQQQHELDQRQQELEQLRAEQAPRAAELATAQQEHRLALSRLTVAETTREHLATELAQAQAEVSRLRQSVAFYERVIPAAGESSRVQIRSAEVYPLGSNLLQYRVLVMRNRTANDFFQGELRFVATGEQDGSSATIPLERLSIAPTSEAGANPTPAENAAPGLRFQQYQRATGLLAIPPGFTPATITVRVLEGKAIRAEHTVTLAQESLT